MNPIAVGGVIVGLLLLAFLWSKKKSAPASTPAGGTAISDSPSVTTPIPEGGTSAAVSTATPEIPKGKLVKKIRIIKDTTSRETGTNPADGGWRSFQVAEVHAYTPNGKLTASDFSDATLSSMYDNGYEAKNVLDNDPNTFMHTAESPRIGELSLTLKNESVLTRVEVLNRQDCCYERLAGANILLEDSRGNTIWSGVLTEANYVQIFNIPAGSA